MTMAALMGFALALMVAAGSPGPSIAALIARVLTSGLRDVLPFLAAMWIGEAIWLAVAVAGLAVVAQAFAAWAELTLTMLVVLIAIDLGWALTAARARSLLKNRRAVRVANRTSAAVMAGAAAA